MSLYIPKTIKIGFRKRAGTFTGLLGYVIYTDEKGTLRKAASWDSWRDHAIEPLEFENTPRAGYVFNKGVQRSNDWGTGRSVIRVHDPREFEFEISVDNLIGILMHSDVSKRDIAEPCVFAWQGPELVLLPVNSEAYTEATAYTDRQARKVSAKSLVLGRQYTQKKNEEPLTYLGYYPWYEIQTSYPVHGSEPYTCHSQTPRGKRHVFHDGKKFCTPSVSSLACELAPDINPDFAGRLDALLSTHHTQRIVDVVALPLTDSDPPPSAANLVRVTANKALIRPAPSRPGRPLIHTRTLDTQTDVVLGGELYSCAFTPTFSATRARLGKWEETIPLPPDSAGRAAMLAEVDTLKRYHNVGPRMLAALRSLNYGRVGFVLENGAISMEFFN